MLFRSVMYDTMRFYTMSIVEFLDEYFEHPLIKAAHAGSGIIGSALGVMSPGTAYVLLHHAMGEVDGTAGAWGFARGGMGAIAEAMGLTLPGASSIPAADANHIRMAAASIASTQVEVHGVHPATERGFRLWARGVQRRLSLGASQGGVENPCAEERRPEVQGILPCGDRRADRSPSRRAERRLSH